MVQSPARSALTFDQFLEAYPDDQGRYELVNGEIVDMRAIRWHDDIADGLIRLFERQTTVLDYRVTGRLVLGTTTVGGQQQGRHPDVSVVSQAQWRSNRLTYAALDEPIQLAVEVVSTNWEDDHEDDYVDKLDEYQRLGVAEYWIVDYLAIASRSYLGNPKRPTTFVHLLNEQGRYETQAYVADEHILSATFPQLDLTMNQILEI